MNREWVSSLVRVVPLAFLVAEKNALTANDNLTTTKKEIKMKRVIITENYCDDCDNVLHAVFDIKDFESHRRGSIVCECGTVVMPCNECDGIGCGDCPWKNSTPTPAMTDMEYVKWVKENSPSLYEILKDIDNGGKYAEVIRELDGVVETTDKVSKPTESNDMWVVIFDEFDDGGHTGIVNRRAYDSVGEAANAMDTDIERYTNGMTNITIEEDEDKDITEVSQDEKLLCRWAIRSCKRT